MSHKPVTETFLDWVHAFVLTPAVVVSALFWPAREIAQPHSAR